MVQIIRTLSFFQVEQGLDSDGSLRLKRVPCTLASTDRQVEQIIKKNTENTVSSAPQITVYPTEINMTPERRQDPNFVGKIHLRERLFNSETNTYGTEQGNAVTVERLMPNPFDLTVNADVWTTNMQNKLELIQQIAWLFNPSLEIQTSDNYVDWTSISLMELTGINYSSRTIPVGAEEEIDFTTFTFKVPIWLSPPAKVKKLGIIQKIITSVYNSSGNLEDAILSETNLMARVRTTPLKYNTLLLGGEVHLLGSEESSTPNNTQLAVHDEVNHTDLEWDKLSQQFGIINDNVSRIIFEQPDGTEVSGTVAKHPTIKTRLTFTVDIDTIRAATETAIDAIINPLAGGPGFGLKAAVAGQRYLITEDIGNDPAGNPGQQTPDAWPAANAKKNDIIEFGGSGWFVSLEAATNTLTSVVNNLTTNIQYKWDATNSRWVKSYEGFYAGGDWCLII